MKEAIDKEGEKVNSLNFIVLPLSMSESFGQVRRRSFSLLIPFQPSLIPRIIPGKACQKWQCVYDCFHLDQRWCQRVVATLIFGGQEKAGESG